MSKSDPPQPPNPQATAAAQTGTNVSTAIANAYLNNVNQVTPTGNLSYVPTQQFDFTDPTTGQKYQIPRFTSFQELTPVGQATQEATSSAKLNLADLAKNESWNLKNLLSTGADFMQQPWTPQAGNPNLIDDTALPSTTFGDAGQQLTGYGDAGDIARNYGPNDFSADRSRVEQSLFERMQPQLDRQRTQLEQRLADQGIRYGSPAYSAAMDDFNRQLTDTRLGVIAQGGQEQKLQADLAAQRAGFANAAQQQAYEQTAGRAGFANTAQQTAFQQAAARGQFSNQSLAQQLAQRQALLGARNNARTQFLQEQYAQRALPINEVSALLGQTQVSQPQFMQTPVNQIPTTDVASLINQNFSQQFQNYQTQQQAQNQLLGGILGAGGSIGAGLAFRSDRRAKKNIHRIGSVFAAEPQPVEEPVKKKLPVYEYSYKDDSASLRHIGPMAQDMEKVDPSAVGEDKRGVKYINAGRMMGSILRAA